VLLGLLVYRTFSWRDVYPGLVATVSLSGAILFIIAAATAMSWILAQSGLSREIVAAMRGVPGGAWTFIALSIVVFILLGCVLEGLPAIVLLGPLLFPVARAFGINDVHYSMIVMLSMGIGLFMPPIGSASTRLRHRRRGSGPGDARDLAAAAGALRGPAGRGGGALDHAGGAGLTALAAFRPWGMCAPGNGTAPSMKAASRATSRLPG
jgi:hypothetical protein